jgi:hypothetical protein
MQDKPVVGAGVFLDREEQSATASDGSFLLRGVRKGEHELRIEALGARAHRSSFFISRRSEEVNAGSFALTPSLTLVSDGSGGLQPPNDVLNPTFSLDYDFAFWLDGDPDVISRVQRVTYRVPTRLSADPVIVSSQEGRFCANLRGTLVLRIGETVNGAVDAKVDFADGQSLHLSTEDVSAASGSRPTNCGSVGGPPRVTTPLVRPPSTLRSSPSPRVSTPPPSVSTASPSPSNVASATIALSKTSGPPGTLLQVSGKGFASRETIRITVSPDVVSGSATSGDDGSFSAAAVQIPTSGVDEAVQIRAEGVDKSHRVATQTFTIPAPTLMLSPTATTGKVRIRVTSLAISENVKVCVLRTAPGACATPGTGPQVSPRTGEEGIYCSTVVLTDGPAPLPPGSTYTIRATGVASGRTVVTQLTAPVPWRAGSEICP